MTKLLQTIETFKANTAKMKAENPAIDSIEWQIENIPMDDFNDFVRKNDAATHYMENAKRLMSIHSIDYGKVWLYSESCEQIANPIYIPLKEVQHG